MGKDGPGDWGKKRGGGMGFASLHAGLNAIFFVRFPGLTPGATILGPIGATGES